MEAGCLFRKAPCQKQRAPMTTIYVACSTLSILRGLHDSFCLFSLIKEDGNK